MKLNMTSLKNKLLFFLVFFILSNFTTSDDFKECNVHEIYYSEQDTFKNFSMAMTALSEPLLTLTFLATSVNDLYGYYESHSNVVTNIGEGIFNAKHQELLEYFSFVMAWKNIYANSKINSTLADKQADLVGYFRSFADKIDEMADRINKIMLSPEDFCSNREDADECREALCIMLKRDDAMTMTGSEALKFCYLNYTYLDFTKENSVMINYFSYALEVTTQIGEFNKITHCIRNLQVIFNDVTGTNNNIKIAMSVLSEDLIQLFYTTVDAKNLYGYFLSHSVVINGLDNAAIKAVHREVINHFIFQLNVNDAGSSNSIFRFYNSSIPDVLGYFLSFAKQIEDNAETFDHVVKSPQSFCQNRKDYDAHTCYIGLCTMFNLKGFDLSENVNKLLEKSGSEALKYVFLKYTYVDFTINYFFPETEFFLNINMLLNDESKKKQIDIMIKYFIYLLEMAATIGDFTTKENKNTQDRFIKPLRKIKKGPHMFLSIKEYCENK